MNLVMQAGKVYRYHPQDLVGHWTVYEQRERSVFFSGSADPQHRVGVSYEGSGNYPGRRRNRRDWEELV